jgi:hypothetical protein
MELLSLLLDFNENENYHKDHFDEIVNFHSNVLFFNFRFNFNFLQERIPLIHEFRVSDCKLGPKGAQMWDNMTSLMRPSYLVVTRQNTWLL